MFTSIPFSLLSPICVQIKKFKKYNGSPSEISNIWEEKEVVGN